MMAQAWNTALRINARSQGLARLRAFTRGTRAHLGHTVASDAVNPAMAKVTAGRKLLLWSLVLAALSRLPLMRLLGNDNGQLFMSATQQI